MFPIKDAGIFRDFINKSANLLTVFGILNALLIYTSQLEHSGVKNLLYICFYGMSFLVLVDIFVFSTSFPPSLKIALFASFLMFVQFGLAFNLLIIYPKLMYLIYIFMMVYMIGAYFTMFKNSEGIAKYFILGLIICIVLTILSLSVFENGVVASKPILTDSARIR